MIGSVGVSADLAVATQLRSPVLTARGLTKTYELGGGPVHALRGVDLDVSAGDVLVLLGPSGSGKSTLLNILGGLDLPSRGSIVVGDEDVARFDAHALTQYRRRHVGFVFQSYNLIPTLTAAENVELGAIGSDRAITAPEALALVGVLNLSNRFPAQLSGGEQQRVAVARAIVKQPDILLCDEPTGALDSKTGTVVLHAIQAVNRRFATPIVLVTHNAVIGAMADRVLHLIDGMVTRIDRNEVRAMATDLSW